jgi:hypothetical protein
VNGFDDQTARRREHIRNTELLDAELPDARFVDETYLRWLYDENPLGRGYTTQIDSPDGIRVGHYGLVPQRYRNHEGEQPFVFSLNAVARVGSQRRGVFAEMGGRVWNEARDAGVQVVIGVTNVKSTGAVRKAGWRVLGPMPVKVALPGTRRPRNVESYDLTPDLVRSPAFADLTARLDESPAWNWTNCWTTEQLRWRVSAPNSPRFTLHIDDDLVALSTGTREHGVPFAVIVKVLPRDGRFGPLDAGTMVTAACRHHGAPAAVYAGHNRHVVVRGIGLPERLKPVPLVLCTLSLTPDIDQQTFALDTFEFLDMDAY